jgi:hypothetical protein
MKHFLIAISVFALANQSLHSQSLANTAKDIDALYREDQIYLGVTYNILNHKPLNVSQNGFSGGFHLGFIRDFPINTRRNLALGIGLGLSVSSFNQNLKISETNGQFEFEVLGSGDFDKNKFDLYQLELPFEFRWRTSTVESYKFWRVYTGFKLGYVVFSRTKFIGSDQSYAYSIDNAINLVQYGITFSAGYDSWNLHLYYGLNSIFKNNKLNDEPINLTLIKVGLMFYVL